MPGVSSKRRSRAYCLTSRSENTLSAISYDHDTTRHSIASFNTSLESSLPKDFESQQSRKKSEWFARSFSVMSSFFRPFLSSFNSFESVDDMPLVFPDTKKLEKEEVIKVKSNLLREIPDTLGKLRSVVELRITRSKFKKGDGVTQIPFSISKLSKLKILDLRGNPLGTITLGICHLESLQELTLEGCDLSEVPLALSELRNLQRVILDNNNINKPNFSPSSNVSYLSLVNNSIADYPCKLPSNLATLDLSENFLTALPPQAFTPNSLLAKLYLRENNLQYLPATIVCLKLLRVFDVSKNSLRQLPEDIGELKSLVSLNISYNELTTLPRSIIKLCETDTHLLCGENPLQKPPMEVGLQGLPSIRNYFKALDDSEEVRNKRLKLMLLGDGRAGKTFLAKAISTCEEPQPCSDETIGIDCFHWKEKTGADTLEILIVDCAGQKKYMLTHQLFLSTGMIFAVVVNLQTYEMNEKYYHEKLGFWIDLIIARVPHATILIVPTHLDLITDENELVAKCTHIITSANEHVTRCKLEARKENTYGNDDGDDNSNNGDSGGNDLINPVIPKSFKYDNFTEPSHTQITNIIYEEAGKHTIHLIPVSNRYSLPGLKLLREEIVQIANNKDLCPHVHRCVPESWTKLEQFCIKERKERKNRSIITIEEIEIKTSYFDCHEDYVEALRFLDSMGHILYFENSNIILLNPRYLFELMKLLFTHHHDNFVYQLDYGDQLGIFKSDFDKDKDHLTNNAHLSMSFLRCIWSKYIPDDTLFGQVVVLFEKFDLFYEVESTVADSEKKFLVSWFMKDECPTNMKQPTLEGKSVIVTRFETIGVLPDGFFQRFIIRVYTKGILLNCTPWNYGFKGLVENGDIMCEYMKGEFSSTITLAASAHPNHIYHMWKTIVPILNVLEQFISEWKGINHRVYSVCPDCYKSHKPHPNIWRLDTNKVNTQANLICRTEATKVDRWLIYPPPGILLDNEVENKRFDREHMAGELDEKEKNKISELLKRNCTQLQIALDVHLGEEEEKWTSHNRVSEIIKLWERKNPQVSRELFIRALHNMHPYPHDVVELLMSPT